MRKMSLLAVILIVLGMLPAVCGPLHEAAQKGDLVEVTRLLGIGAEVNATNENGDTPLHCAATTGNVDVVKLLVEKGADVNGGEASGWTPLMVAAQNGGTEVSRFLIEKGANVSAKTKADSTGMTSGVPSDGKRTQSVRTLISDRAKAKDKANLATLFSVLVSAYSFANPLMTYNGVLNTRTFFTPGVYNAQMPSSRRIVGNSRTDTTYDVADRTALHYAAANGYTDIASLLLEKGAEVNAKDEDGATPFDLASDTDKADAAKLLVSKGAAVVTLSDAVRYGAEADVKQRLDSGASVEDALRVAAECGRNDMVEYLLSHGANINAVSKSTSFTPLYRAAANGHLETIRLLLDKGAKQTVKGASGFTPLHVAASEGYTDVVRLLVEKGGNVNLFSVDCTPLQYAMPPAPASGGFRWNEDCTPLHFAARFGRVETVKFLLANGALPNANRDGSFITSAWKKRKPLHEAASSGSAQTVKALLDANAVIDSPDYYRATPLFDAARSGNVETITMLLDKGLKINATAITDTILVKTHPLRCAIENGRIDAALLLISRGADIQPKGEGSKTLMYVAAELGCVDIVKALIDKGADPNDKADGRTALQIAAMNGNVDVAKLLIENGADVLIKNKTGKTAAELSVQRGTVECARILVEKDPSALDLHAAALLGRNDDLKRLTSDKSVNNRDDAGSTPLFKAVIGGNLETVKLLLDNGAKSDIQDKAGLTPLHVAALEGQTAAAKLLIESGANIEALDKMKATPLIWSAAMGDSQTTALLLSKGAKVNIQTVDGFTPLIWAASSGNTDVIRMLIKNGADPNKKLDNETYSNMLAVLQSHPNAARLISRYSAQPVTAPKKE